MTLGDEMYVISGKAADLLISILNFLSHFCTLPSIRDNVSQDRPAKARSTGIRTYSSTQCPQIIIPTSSTPFNILLSAITLPQTSTHNRLDPFPRSCSAPCPVSECNGNTPVSTQLAVRLFRTRLRDSCHWRFDEIDGIGSEYNGMESLDGDQTAYNGCRVGRRMGEVQGVA